jgi:hypothetical protein
MKKNKYFQFIVISMTIFLGISLSSQASAIDLSKSKIKVPPVRTQPSQAPVPESAESRLNNSLKNDVKISSIESLNRCGGNACTRLDEDVIFTRGVGVTLYNIGPAIARNVTVTLTYYLSATGERVFVSRTVAVVPVNEYIQINMTRAPRTYAPFFVMSRYGFVATVQAANDRLLSNNSKTTYSCRE